MPRIALLGFDKVIITVSLSSSNKSSTISVIDSINPGTGKSEFVLAQVYKELGDLDKAKSRIEQLLLDENFNSIKGELNLELAKIELDKNNLEIKNLF